MPDLKLSGPALSALRALVRTPAAGAVWAATKNDFGVDALAALPASDRLPLSDTVRPVAGRAPHTWDDQQLGVPTPSRPTIRTLSEALASRALTATELTERFLAAVEGDDFGDATFSPIIAHDAERARREAAEADQRLTAGAPKSPLDGIAIPLKDEMAIRGLPTWGGTSYRGEVADDDAWLPAQLRRAGAVVAAKTHATEWGLNPWGANSHHDLPRNAWSSEHGAGGSSTGSGVAVALGLAPAAIGSDGGGSIRIPSCLNGIFGLKPTWQRIGRTGDSWQVGGSVGHLGPLGGTPSDLVELLLAASGIDPDDPATTFAPDGHDTADAWRAALGRGVRGARIGLVRSGWDAAEPETAAVVRQALAALEAEGAVIVDVELPLEAHVNAIGALQISSETCANLSDDLAAHGPAFGDELAVVLGLLSRLPAQDLLRAARTRAALRQQAAAVFRDHVDLLAFPTTLGPAVPYPASRGRHDTLAPAWTARMTRLSFLANLTGLPAGTAPVGRVDGLPVGLQLIGDAWDEASVIAGLAHVQRLGLSELGRPKGFVDLLG